MSNKSLVAVRISLYDLAGYIVDAIEAAGYDGKEYFPLSAHIDIEEDDLVVIASKGDTRSDKYETLKAKIPIKPDNSSKAQPTKTPPSPDPRMLST